MFTLSSSEVRGQWAEVVDRVRVGRDRVVVKKNGKRIVAVVPIEDLDTLERLEDAVDIREAKAALARNDFVPWEVVSAKIDKARRKTAGGKKAARGSGRKA